MSTLTLILAILSCSLIAATHGLDIAVYWGQNFDERSLSDTCDTGNYAYVIIGFLNTFGGGRTPALNIAGHSPEGLESQIKYCQSKNVKVLLSIGGPGGNYSVDSRDDALNVASYLFNNFLQGQSESKPFGSAVFDGIDFQIMHGSPNNYGLLAAFLSGYRLFHFEFFLTAAPRCPYPDPNLQIAIDTGLFDAIWVQFYNNSQCEYSGQNAVNLTNSWKVWSRSANTEKVFLGFPADPLASVSGYMPPEKVKSQMLPVAEKSNKFGGIMLWYSYWDAISNFSSTILYKDVDDKVAFYEPEPYMIRSILRKPK